MENNVYEFYKRYLNETIKSKRVEMIQKERMKRKDIRLLGRLLIIKPENFIYIMCTASKKEYDKFSYTKRAQIIEFVKEWNLKRLISHDEFNQIFFLAHNSSMGGGHLGEKKTMSKIMGEYFFKGISSAIKSKIRLCIPCQKSRPIKGEKLIVPIISSYPFERIVVDLVGPLTETAKNNKYICVIVDHFTKWPEAYPIKDKSAVSVAMCLAGSFIPRHGMFKYFQTDRGSEFNNELIDFVLKKCHINRKSSAPYNPQCNGIVEKMNSTIIQALGKYVNENLNDWDDFLEGFLASYRWSKHSTTGFSPYKALYGRDPIQPVDFHMVSRGLLTCDINDIFPKQEILPHHVNSEFVDSENKTGIIIAIQKRIKENAEKMIEKGRKLNSINRKELFLGDYVLRKSEKRNQNRSNKLMQLNQGPYKIIRITKNLAYLKEDRKKPLKTGVSLSHLVKYQTGDDIGMDNYSNKLSKLPVDSEILESKSDSIILSDHMHDKNLTNSCILNPNSPISAQIKSSCLHLDTDTSMDSFLKFLAKNIEVVKIDTILRKKFREMILNNDWLSCSFIDYFASLRTNTESCYIHIFKIQTAMNSSEMKKRLQKLLHSAPKISLIMNTGNHWICITIKHEYKKIEYRDSLNTSHEGAISALDKNILELDYEVERVVGFKQEDGFSCGYYALFNSMLSIENKTVRDFDLKKFQKFLLKIIK